MDVAIFHCIPPPPLQPSVLLNLPSLPTLLSILSDSIQSQMRNGTYSASMMLSFCAPQSTNLICRRRNSLVKYILQEPNNCVTVVCLMLILVLCFGGGSYIPDYSDGYKRRDGLMAKQMAKMVCALTSS